MYACFSGISLSVLTQRFSSGLLQLWPRSSILSRGMVLMYLLADSGPQVLTYIPSSALEARLHDFSELFYVSNCRLHACSALDAPRDAESRCWVKTDPVHEAGGGGRGA